VEPLLYLVHRLPYPPNKGDKIRSYHILRYLALRYRVHLGTFVDSSEDEKHVAPLRELCADVFVVRLRPTWGRLRSITSLLRGQALTVAFYRNARMHRWVDTTLREHAIRKAVAFSSPMAQYLVPGGSLRLVVDYCDVDSAKWSDYAPQHRWPMSFVYRREARRLLEFERDWALRSHACVFATHAEMSLFASLAPECASRLHAIGNGVDQEYFAPRADRPTPYAVAEEALVFTGAMDYWPNVDAVVWFANEILPRLVRARPRLRFFIVGMNPSPAVRALAANPAVVVTGKVNDVRPYVQHALAVVAPLRIARGIQNKVIEAMAMGRPVVVSEAASRGLCATPGSDFISAPQNPVAFSTAVLELLARPDREVIGQRARAAVVVAYDWEHNLSSFCALLGGDSKPDARNPFSSGANTLEPASNERQKVALTEPAAADVENLTLVSVIIPTTCEAVRSSQIERAIGSVLDQEHVKVELIVVVNGDRYDEELFKALQRSDQVRVIFEQEGNVSLARFRGLKSASGEFVCFLDDDDEYLPMSLHERTSQMRRHPEIDVLVTNGYNCKSGDVVVVDANLERRIKENLPVSFFYGNWFHSPASTFRRSSVDAALFDIRRKYFEWTFLYFSLLSSGKRIGYSNALTYRYMEDSPLSVSKTDAYRAAYPEFLLDLLQKPLDPELRKGVRRKYQAALNGVSQMHLRGGRIGQAAMSHWKCLANGGWRYVPYTRKIVLAGLRRSVSTASRD